MCQAEFYPDVGILVGQIGHTWKMKKLFKEEGDNM